MTKLSDNKKLSTMDWSVRTANCFRDSKLKTVGEVRRMPDHELLRMPNFGRVSLEEVRAQIPFEEQPKKPAKVDVAFFLQNIQQYQIGLNQKMSQTLDEMREVNSRHQTVAGDVTKLDAGQREIGRKVVLIENNIIHLLEHNDRWPKLEQFNQFAKAVNKIAAYANAMDAYKEELKRLTQNQITDLAARVEGLSLALDKLRAEQLHMEVRLKRLNTPVEVKEELEGTDAEGQAETKDL